MSAGSAITIDVDGVAHYHAIHGLPPPVGADPVWRVGVPRLLELCAAHGVRATLFVVTADLADADARALVRRAHELGHEIASHSHAHRYDLSALPPGDIDEDLRRSVELITEVVGVAPRGFRAPGYTLSADLVAAIARAGFAYDSSVMEAPAYWAARALARQVLRARGRTSASRLGDPRQFLPGYAPPGLRELPITGALGWPWLGTTLALLPAPVGALTTALARVSARANPVVLELHAIDLCEQADGFADELARAQPDLAVPLARKRARLDAAIASLARGCRPLAEWATRP